jgi:hypothetical protein
MGGFIMHTLYLPPEVGVGDGLCLYCGVEDHDANCPTMTNYWVALKPIQCYLCDGTIDTDEQYRMLPALPEDELEDGDEGITPIQQSGYVIVVCIPCSTLRVLPRPLDGLRDTLTGDSTPAG